MVARMLMANDIASLMTRLISLGGFRAMATQAIQKVISRPQVTLASGFVIGSTLCFPKFLEIARKRVCNIIIMSHNSELGSNHRRGFQKPPFTQQRSRRRSSRLSQFRLVHNYETPSLSELTPPRLNSVLNTPFNQTATTTTNTTTNPKQTNKQTTQTKWLPLSLSTSISILSFELPLGPASCSWEGGCEMP
jgi:hypothetical protein